MVIDVVADFTGEAALSELLYADDLVLMSETIEGLRDVFLKSTHVFESNGLKVSLGKTMVMVNSGIIHSSLSKVKLTRAGSAVLEQ